MKLPDGELTKEQADAYVLHMARDMKAFLKTQSKNDLIRQIFELTNHIIELRNENKQLEQELQGLKAAKETETK